MPSRIEDFTKQAINMALFIINNEVPVHVRSQQRKMDSDELKLT